MTPHRCQGCHEQMICERDMLMVCKTPKSHAFQESLKIIKDLPLDSHEEMLKKLKELQKKADRKKRKAIRDSRTENKQAD